MTCIDACHFSQANISFWTVSPTLNYLACGTTDGNLKLYSQKDQSLKHTGSNKGSFSEIIAVGQCHDACITSIFFCDECNYFVSCAGDTSIMFWDFRKRHLRTIVCNNPMRAIICLNKEGDCVISQSNYLLRVKRDAWYEGEAEDDTWGSSESTVDVGEQMTEEDIKIFYTMCLNRTNTSCPETNKPVTFLTSTCMQSFHPEFHAAKGRERVEEDEINLSQTDYLRKQVKTSQVSIVTHEYRHPSPHLSFLSSHDRIMGCARRACFHAFPILHVL